MDKKSYCIGIDEVGRGPIAGPVCLCAFKIKDQTLKIKKFKSPLRDSKKLTERQRQEWFIQIKEWKKEGKVDYALSFIDSKYIDRYGISGCIKLAIARCLKKLNADVSIKIMLDGALKAPKEFKNQKTIIKGDEKIPAITLASIVAKVSRDALMKKLSKKYPDHGFEMHKGYGTKFHYEQIKNFGVLPIHRETYLQKFYLKN